MMRFRDYVKAAGWELLEWGDGNLTVALGGDVDITANAVSHDESAALLLPWLERLRERPEDGSGSAGRST